VNRAVIPIVTAASGTFTQNTVRQSIVVSTPPNTGPSAAKNADPPASTPSAAPRR
jgi:hypothetical protein